MPDAVMLFAAGFGTRMGALTSDRPKPLIKVAGLPLIDHALGLVRDLAPSQIVVNAHYKAQQIVDHVAGTGVRVAVETPDILDTGGGLKAAMPLLESDVVFTMNTDAVWTGPNPLDTLAEAWDPTRMDALLLLVPPERTRAHSGAGDFRLAQDGRAERGGALTFTGAQIVKAGAVAAHPPGAFSLNAVWDGLATRRRLFGTLHPGLWCDVGHPGGIDEAERMLAEAR